MLDDYIVIHRDLQLFILDVGVSALKLIDERDPLKSLCPRTSIDHPIPVLEIARVCHNEPYSPCEAAAWLITAYVRLSLCAVMLIVSFGVRKSTGNSIEITKPTIA